MISSKHLFSKKFIKKSLKGGSKSKKGGKSDIKTVTIKLQPQYIGGDEEPEINNDYGLQPEEQVDTPEEQEQVEENNVEEPVEEEEPEDEDDTEPINEGEDDAEPEIEDKEETESVDDEDIVDNKKKTKKQVLVPQLFGFRDQLKLYHWQTQSHSRHVASGDFVTNLSVFIDTFVEVYQGKYGRIKLDKIVSVKLQNLNDTTVIEYLNKYKNYLLYTLPGTLDDVKDTDLLNLKDEMLAEANKLLYLFTLR